MGTFKSPAAVSETQMPHGTLLQVHGQHTLLDLDCHSLMMECTGLCQPFLSLMCPSRANNAALQPKSFPEFHWTTRVSLHGCRKAFKAVRRLHCSGAARLECTCCLLESDDLPDKLASASTRSRLLALACRPVIAEPASFRLRCPFLKPPYSALQRII